MEFSFGDGFLRKGLFFDLPKLYLIDLVGVVWRGLFGVFTNAFISYAGEAALWEGRLVRTGFFAEGGYCGLGKAAVKRTGVVIMRLGGEELYWYDV